MEAKCKQILIWSQTFFFFQIYGTMPSAMILQSPSPYSDSFFFFFAVQEVITAIEPKLQQCPDSEFLLGSIKCVYNHLCTSLFYFVWVYTQSPCVTSVSVYVDDVWVMLLWLLVLFIT